MSLRPRYGVDFIKTSTGKAHAGNTPEAVLTIADTVACLDGRTPSRGQSRRPAIKGVIHLYFSLATIIISRTYT